MSKFNFEMIQKGNDNKLEGVFTNIFKTKASKLTASTNGDSDRLIYATGLYFQGYHIDFIMDVVASVLRKLEKGESIVWEHDDNGINFYLERSNEKYLLDHVDKFIIINAIAYDLQAQHIDVTLTQNGKRF